MRVRKIRVPGTNKRFKFTTILMLAAAGFAVWKFWPQIKGFGQGMLDKFKGANKAA